MDVFGGTFSSKFIGKVCDFFIGSIGRQKGAFGGFLGVASKMGGDRGPLEFGDRAPLMGVRSPLCCGIWSSRGLWQLTLAEGVPFACGMVLAYAIVFPGVSGSPRIDSLVPFHWRVQQASRDRFGKRGHIGNRTGARGLRGRTAPTPRTRSPGSAARLF